MIIGGIIIRTWNVQHVDRISTDVLSTVEDFMENSIFLNAKLIRYPSSTFFAMVENSIKDKGRYMVEISSL